MTFIFTACAIVGLLYYHQGRNLKLFLDFRTFSVVAQVSRISKVTLMETKSHLNVVMVPKEALQSSIQEKNMNKCPRVSFVPRSFTNTL